MGHGGHNLGPLGVGLVKDMAVELGDGGLALGKRAEAHEARVCIGRQGARLVPLHEEEEVAQLATRRAVPFAPTLRDATPDAHAGDKRARIAATYG